MAQEEGMWILMLCGLFPPNRPLLLISNGRCLCKRHMVHAFTCTYIVQFRSVGANDKMAVHAQLFLTVVLY